MRLTIREIRNLAEFCGLVFDQRSDPQNDDEREDEEETFICIEDCPDKGFTDDDGKIIHCEHIAWYADLSLDEGVCPLGKEAPDARDR